MDGSSLDPQRMLNRAAVVIATAGMVGIVVIVCDLLLFAPPRSSLSLAFWTTYLLRAVIVPGLYFAMAKPVARHSYGALATCGVVSIASLIGMSFRLVWIFHRPRYSLIEFAIGLGAHAAVFAVVLMSRAAITTWPNRPAVEIATKRAGVAMYISGMALILLTLAILAECVIGMIELVRYEQFHYIVFFAAAVALAFMAIFGFAGGILLADASSARRGERPRRMALASAVVSLAAALFIVDFIFGGNIFYFRYNLWAQWLPFVVRAMFIWQLIELIHARRICDDPASFGFEPIFATPVIPIRSDDVPSI